MNKELVRSEMLSRVRALSENSRRESDKKIEKRILSLSEVKRAKRVFVYVGVGYEVSTSGIIDTLLSDVKAVFVPLCHGNGEMDARRISSQRELTSGRYGIPEPVSTSEKISPEELDLIIVPGVAFGEDCSRLGRGGGYYDRFLSKAKGACKIALCREINIEKTVPCEAYDEKVDIVVTDARVIKNKVR